MNREDLHAWIGRYEQLWRTPGTDGLGDLFAEDVSYLASPWDEPVRGLAALATFWEDDRNGPEEEFALSADVVAVEGDVGVARVAVRYKHGGPWRDLWIVHLDQDGRCTEFEEWPFAPPRP